MDIAEKMNVFQDAVQVDPRVVAQEHMMTEENLYIPEKTVGAPFVDDPKMRMRDVNVFYDTDQAIHGVSLDIGKNEVVAPVSYTHLTLPTTPYV